MPQAIDNTNVKFLSNATPSVAGFLPVVGYVYDASAATIVVTDGSTIPSGDTLVKVLVHVWDKYSKSVEGAITVTSTPGAQTLDVSGLNRAKPLDILCTVITTKNLVADGGAYNIQAAGNVGDWDVQEEA